MGRDYSHDSAEKERTGAVRLTRAQSREIDRVAIERYGIPGIVLMENAARGAADIAFKMLRNRIAPAAPAVEHVAQQRPESVAPDVLVICGGGNNGGDGLAVARHLHLRGCKVRIALTIDPRRYEGDALTNWKIIGATQIPRTPFSPEMIGRPDLIVDAIFGTGLSLWPRAPFPDIANALNTSDCPILAIDVPSGLDCDTGRPLGPVCVRATRTVTFVAEKVGFAVADARPFLGDVCVADIGCPPEVLIAVIAASSPA